jgi:hypothetical protein
MTASRVGLVRVDISNPVNLTAIETLFSTKISGLTSGFLPESFLQESQDYTDGTLKAGVFMITAKSPYQAWQSETTAIVKALSLASRASSSAVETAITTIVDAQEALSRSLRDQCVVRVNLNGVVTDVLLMLFTNGNPVPGYNRTLITFHTPAAKGTNNVHAAVASNASNTFPGPFTNPDVPRNLRLVFAASYDGGNVTVVGTDQFDQAVTEVFTGTQGTTQVGTKIFKTVTSATKATVGATANTVSIGTGDKIGLSKKLANTDAVLVIKATTADGFDTTPPTMDATYHAFTPTTTVPNGTVVYKMMANYDTSI